MICHPQDRPSLSCAHCEQARPCQHQCACVNLARTGDVGQVDDFVCFYERVCLEAAARFWSRLSGQRSAQPLSCSHSEPVAAGRGALPNTKE